jgi:hypothetical protein
MANLSFFMTPGSCSTAIHIILEELGEIFEATIVNLPAGDHFKPDFVAMNPKSTIPALRLPDGRVLTEVPVIAQQAWGGTVADQSRCGDEGARDHDLCFRHDPRTGLCPPVHDPELFTQ